MDVEAISHGGQNLYNVDNNLVSNNVNIQIGSQSSVSQDKSFADKPISENDVKKAVKVVNDLLKDKDVHMEYEQDENFKYITIMKVVDNNTKEVINEIPSKKILDMVAQFCEMAGLIVNKKA
ncbi:MULTISPECIES: flagellar protein FlaG [Clostridium]|uniref:flagellar protein FlaG n=1 Tax=Clostridium TaxID=1485 RepID=UPI00069E0435|nr:MULTISPECIES: flagellar protein FlaG [Clostridium]KOF55887.1 hypothetical protein AGR56_02335 [Clostridium sp. DMHC 10]MCD2345264.1 flagellar protein FlaG [Clostridium guangxiense]